MPDLGPYATYVLGAYGASLLILAAVVATTLRASARARAELEALEARRLRRRREAA